MRRLVAIAAFAVLVVGLGCAGMLRSLTSGGQPCFSDSAPSVGRPGTDESYAYLFREWRRSRSKLPAVVRSRILEAIPRDLPDASDLSSEPTCGPEIVAASARAVGDDVIVPTRWLVAQIRAAGATWDVTDVMDRKAQFLIRIATLPDAKLAGYRLGDDEAGPAPAKRYVRDVALAAIGRSNMYANVEEVRAFVRDRLATTTDDRERLLLKWHAAEALGRVPGLPARWLADVRARLAAGPDPIALEVVLVNLELLGSHGKAAGVEAEVRALLEEIVAARGRFPITAGVPGADRDLARLAIAARYDLDVPGGGRYVSPWTPTRQPYDLWRALMHDEPAGGAVAPADVARRLTDLDAELARATTEDARCRILTELARWVPPADADRRFDALVAPVREGTRLRTSRENLCRIDVALALDGVSPDRVAKLVATALDPAAVLPFDGAPEHSLGVTVVGLPYLAVTAAGGLAEHPEWIDASPALRAAITSLALAPLGSPGGHVELQKALQPVHVHLLATASPADGAAIVTAWLADVRAIAGREPDNLYETETAVERIIALSDHATRLGVGDRARDVLSEIAALPLPGHGAANTHPMIVRAASVGAAMLALGD